MTIETTTIGGLPDATTPLTGNERVPMDQAGTTKDATTQDIADLALADAAAARTTLGLGTAAQQDVGTTAGDVVQLDGSGRLPAVDASQLTNLPASAGVTAVTGVAPIASSEGTTPAISISAATTGAAGSMSAADKQKLDGIATSANNYVHPNHSGDVTSDGDGATTISDGAVTLAKMEDRSGQVLIGRHSGGSGTPQEVSVGNGLEFQGSGIRRSALTGDVTAAAGSDSTTIASDAVSNAQLANMAEGTIKARLTAGTGDPEDATAEQIKTLLGVLPVGTTAGTVAAGDDARFAVQDIYIIACSDETTDLTNGTAKVTFRMPTAGTLTAVKATVTTAPVGSDLIVDINEAGTSVLSTKLSIDDGEKTSETAATPPVISDSALADDAEITIDIDQVGSGTAGAGLKVTLYVTRS
jgi:hypothetical protein